MEVSYMWIFSVRKEANCVVMAFVQVVEESFSKLHDISILLFCMLVYNCKFYWPHPGSKG